MLVGTALLVAMILAFLLVWHLRWRAMFTRAAAIPASAGVVIPIAVEVPEAVVGDFHRWVADCRSALSQDATRGFWERCNSGVLMCIAPLTPDRAGCAGGAEASNLAEPREGFEPPLAQDLADRLAGLLGRGLRLGQVGTPGQPCDPDLDLAEEMDVCARAAARWRVVSLTRGMCDLDALDALCAALGPRCAWISGAGVIVGIRDAAYLDAQLAGTIDPARLERWRVPDDPLPQLLVALDCRRRFVIPEQIAAQFARPPWLLFGGPAIDANGEDLGARLRRWTDWPRVCSAICDDDGRDLDAIAVGDRTRHLYDASVEATILLRTNRHRYALLASSIASAWGRGHADLRDLDLRGGSARAALQCTGDTFHVTIDLSPTQDPPLAACWEDVPEQSPDEGIVISTSDPTRPFFAWDGAEMHIELPSDQVQSTRRPVPTNDNQPDLRGKLQP